MRGTFRLVMKGEDGGTVEDVGKFIEIRRREGGSWQLSQDIFNSDLAE